MDKRIRDAFRTFSTSARPILHLMDDVDAEVSEALKDAAIRAKHEVVRSACVVLLSGLLESFLRRCAELFFEELVRRNLDYSMLPESMREHHFVAGLDELRRIARADKNEAPPTFERTLAQIARLVHAPTVKASSLYWEAFADTKGNPGPDVIVAYMKNFAIKDPLRAIASAIQTGEPLLRLKLTTFILMRNECAHTGKTKTTPLPSEVRELVHLLRSLALAITKVLEKQVSTLCTSATPHGAT